MPATPHHIAFKNIGLRYNGKTALENINLEIRPGEIVAIVGKSGGGKTSLVNLIPCFYDTSEGGIYINGVDIKKVALKSLREQIAIVSQDSILFNESISKNIAYGKRDCDRQSIVSASKASYCYDFIQNLSGKFDNEIGELGGRLSGGEKQRICIARALLKDAPILILDEATSSLDSESEMIVQKALENLMKGRTTLIIAHRLSTIACADRIIVLSKSGKIFSRHRSVLFYFLYVRRYLPVSSSSPWHRHSHSCMPRAIHWGSI
jgi:ATP-binding cassette, subfamily B, bacterial MsbA